MDVILLERVEKLGQMGDVVTVKPGYARNFLLPRGKALRATTDNRARFDHMRTELEATNLERRAEAEAVAAKLDGARCTLLRQASDSAQLYGSVTARDIADALTADGRHVDRGQVVLERPIKSLGIHRVRVVLHPEVAVVVEANVARTAEEAETQALAASGGGEAEDEADAEAAALFASDDEAAEDASEEAESAGEADEDGETA